MSKIKTNCTRHFSYRTKRNRRAVKIAFSNITVSEYDRIVQKALLGSGQAL